MVRGHRADYVGSEIEMVQQGPKEILLRRPSGLVSCHPCTHARPFHAVLDSYQTVHASDAPSKPPPSLQSTAPSTHS